MIRISFVILLLILFTSPAWALSLDQTVEAALRNHKRIEQFRAQADQSRAELGISKSTFLPRVDIDYSYNEREKDPLSLADTSSTLSVAASINLFNGLQDYYNYQAAKQRISSAGYQLRGTMADITLEARQAFIEGLRTIHSVNTAAEGVELLERQKRDAKLKFDYGLIARNDLLRVEVELSSARQDLLQAQGEQQITFRQIERVTGLHIVADESLVELSETGFRNPDYSQVDVLQKEMLNNRSELLYLRSELLAAKQDRRANKGDYLPSLDLSVSHDEYGETLSPLNYDQNDNLVTLQASWNLFDGFAREESLAAADARVRSLAAVLQDTEAELIFQLDTALQNHKIARGRQQEARAGVVSAEENYRVTENRFQQQQATTVDLLDAQFLLTRSRKLEIDARYDRYLSVVQLERILESSSE